MKKYAAFTLIELLVVITIIAILAGLSLAAVSAVRRTLAIAETGRRIAEVQAGLQSYAAGRSDAMGLELLLKDLRERVTGGVAGQPSGLPGVVAFRMDTRIGFMSPKSGETWPELSGGRPNWMLAHPWGVQATDFLTDPEGNNPPLRLPNPTEESALPIDEFGISDLMPDFSPELLSLAGVIPYENSIDRVRELYRTDRRPRSRWNDAWGNPLVIGFAWYHPRYNGSLQNLDRKGGSLHWTIGDTRALKGNREDIFIERANEKYGFYRAVYVSVAAVGSRPPATVTVDELRDPAAVWTGDTGIQRRLWQAVDASCNRDATSAELWRSIPGRDLAAQPPWKGVKNVRIDGSVHLLSAPMEIH